MTDTNSAPRAMSPEERAKYANLAILLQNGISECDAGFDTVVSLNETGLAIIARAIRAAEDEALEQAAKSLECDCEHKGSLTERPYCWATECPMWAVNAIRARTHD